MDTGLSGKVVLITGAAMGIGRATAEAFAGEGARLALVDLAGDQLEELAGSVGVEAATAVADLSTREGVE